MRTSHRRMNQLINEEKSKINDERLFSSSAFAGYLMDIAETAIGRYDSSIIVKTMYDASDGAMLACTDNHEILINTGNYLTRSFPNRKLKADSLVGLNAHEIGHVLFTDFKVSETYFRCLRWGSIYPEFNEELSITEQRNLIELERFLQTDTDVRRAVVLKAAKHLLNILEDAYIEAMICDAFPGRFATGILLNNIRFSELVPSIDEQLKNGNSRFAVFANLLLQYCNSGDINDRDGYTGEIMDKFVELLPVVDDAIYDDDMKVRCRATNLIMLKVWDYIAEIADDTVKEQTQNKLDNNESIQNLESKLDKELSRRSKYPSGKGTTGPLTRNKPLAGLKAELKDRRKILSEALQGAMQDNTLLETDDFEEGDSGGVSFDPTYRGLGNTDSSDDISRILSTVAEDTVYNRLNDELTKELKEEARKTRLGNAHKGIHININRMRDISQDYIEQYNAVAPALLVISKQMQKRLFRIFKDTAYSEKETSLLMGKRIEPRLLMDANGRIFSRNHLPSKRKSLAVALLLDESGSMSFNDRAVYARAAAIIVYDFCKAMNVPVMIIGHTEQDAVELYSYTDFDSNDPKDRYRLMDISSRSVNRDGAALRFVAERLMKQPEENKLLMIVSDGQPAGSGGYIGTAAEADLRGIRQEYINKGVIFLAAAIGSDKENIERIYGSSFLDITDLKELPYLLVRRIEKVMKG